MSTEELDGSKDDAECPTCGRGDFASEMGMKLHHTKVHGDSIAGVGVECATCGGTLRRKQTVVERNDHHFCNDECYGKWQSENCRGEQARHWEGGSVTVECAHCSTSKQVEPHRAGEYDRHFCDIDCQSAWRSEHRAGPDSLKWVSRKVGCANCGTPLRTVDYRDEQYEHRFCDAACKGEWQAEHLRGENNPYYHGGSALYGPNWTEELRESIRERQGRRCAGCGTHESELPRKLDVHHIIPARQFDNPNDRNDESNLVAMCQNCHLSRWEGIPLRPQLAD